MSNKNKAEELAHSISVKIWNDFMARPYNTGNPYGFSFKQLEQAVGKEVNDSRQSEIDELTKIKQVQQKHIDEQDQLIFELTKEVERLKSESLFNAVTVLPEKDAEIERLRNVLIQAQMLIHMEILNDDRFEGEWRDSEEKIVNDIDEVLTTH